MTYARPLCIIFDEADVYVGKYDSTKYLVLFSCDEKYERMCDRIRCLIMLIRHLWDIMSGDIVLLC